MVGGGGSGAAWGTLDSIRIALKELRQTLDEDNLMKESKDCQTKTVTK